MKCKSQISNLVDLLTTFCSFVLDTIFKNEKLGKLFSPETYHVIGKPNFSNIDFNQEWESGLDNPYFPEYKLPMAKFFNVDCNTTVGSYKMGDVESGAMMTLNFKTMPYANNKFNVSEPYFLYDMEAEVTHNGEVWTETIVKAEDVLKTKRIFVMWH